MVTIKQQLVPESNVKTRTFGRYNKKRFITLHETANTSKGANAQAHANLQSNTNPRNASWHWQVDDIQAIQSYEHDVSCWAGGDGRGDGNMNSIHIEICVNSDGDYLKAVGNATDLVKHIMKLEGIPAANVVQHNRWSGKNCPTFLRSGSRGINWSGFLSKVKSTVVEVSNEIRDYLISGDNTPAVKVLQTKLNQVGFKLDTDGIFGNATETAVKAFQKTAGLVVDGVAGKATQTKLDTIIANLSKPIVKPTAPAKPAAQKPAKEVDEVAEAIVIGSSADYGAAEILSVRLKIGIFPKAGLPEHKLEHVYLVGATKAGIQSGKFTDLSGAGRFDTWENVNKFLKK